MTRIHIAIAAILIGTLPATPAFADEFVVQPVQSGSENVRYQQGTPTVELRMTRGAVQIRPMPLDHGSLTFSVAVLNAGQMPALIDTGAFSIRAAKQTLVPISVDELIRRAKSRAGWSKFGTAMLGSAAAVLAGSQQDTFRSSMRTPYGHYYAAYSTPSIVGQRQAYRMLDRTSMGMDAIQARLDQTRADLGNDIIQTTTVDPSGNYAGKIVFERLIDGHLPQHITMTVNWNGEFYNFEFQLAKPGTPAPAFVAANAAAAAELIAGSMPLSSAKPTTSAAVPFAPFTGNAGQGIGGTPFTQVAFQSQPIPNVQSAPITSSQARFNQYTASPWAASGPLAPNLDAIVRRTAELMPRPTHLPEGSNIVGFASANGNLLLRIHASSSAMSADDPQAAKLLYAICTQAAISPVIKQGGTIKATIAWPNGKANREIVLTKRECGF